MFLPLFWKKDATTLRVCPITLTRWLEGGGSVRVWGVALTAGQSGVSGVIGMKGEGSALGLSVRVRQWRRRVELWRGGGVDVGLTGSELKRVVGGVCGLAARVWCVWCVCVVCAASPVSAADVPGELVENRIALFPVQYGGEHGEPMIGAHLPDLSSGLARIWNGEVLSQSALDDAMRQRFVMDIDEAELSKLEAGVKEAENTFHAVSPNDAIPGLERLVRSADERLGQVSASPRHAQLLLKAHLLLWWSLSSVGESERLKTLMSETVGRFPAAVVDTTVMPPVVSEAFARAREAHERESVTLSVSLSGDGDARCSIEVNGATIGDGRNGAVGVKPGLVAYVGGRCGEDVLPPQRVVAQGPMMVRLDMALTRALQRTSAGHTLVLSEGPDQVADMTRVAQAVGRVLGAGQVLLVGSFDEGEGLRTMQLDRIDVLEGVRRCSVRMGQLESIRRVDIDEALRAIREQKPTTHRRITFSEDSSQYLTPDEYVAEKLEEQDSRRVYTWVAAGVTAAVLSSGVLFDFVGRAAQQDLDDCVASSACRGTEQAETYRNNLDDTLVVRDVLYVSAGVLAVGAVALFFIEQPSTDAYLAAPSAPAPAGWRVSPWVSADGGGVELSIPLSND